MRRSYPITFVVFLLVLSVLSNLRANDLQEALPPGASIHQLDNGLEVLLIENPLLPMVGVNVVVKTGSAYETFSTSGMSHMLEHLLFNGTTTRTQKQLYDDVDLIGGYNNANTSYYYTNFMMVTPAEHIVKGMEIQADMLFNSILPEEKFEKEKGIVLEEIAQGRAKPGTQIERNDHGILYTGHAMSLPVVGTYTTIESMKRDDVYSYYKNAYVPNNMIMSVIGNFKTDSMLTVIMNIYGSVSPSNIVSPGKQSLETGFTLPQSDQKRQAGLYHRYYQGENLQIKCFYDIPTILSTADVALLDESLKNQIQKIKDSLSKNNEFKSLEMTSVQNPIRSYVEVSITVNKSTNISSLVEGITQTLKKSNFSLPKETIESFATKAKTDFLKNLEKPHMFGIYNAGLFAEGGIESVFESYNPESYYDAGKWLTTFKITSEPMIIFHHPRENESEETTQAVVSDKLFLDEKSGITIIARQNPATELAALHILFKHKAPLESQFGNDAAKYYHDCFGQRLKTLENQKITQKFGLTFKVNDNPYIPMDNIYLNPDFGYIRIEGLAEDLPGFTNFLTSQLNSFVPTEEEFSKAKSNFMRSSMLMSAKKGQEQFTKMYEDIVYEPDGYPQSNAPLTYENLLKFGEKYFAPGNIIISAVTPATPDSLTNLIAEQLKPTSTAQELEKAYERSLRLLNESKVNETEGGAEQSYLFWGYTKHIAEDEKPALTALSLILSDKIVFDIREKQGRAYRMAAGISLVNDKALFYVRLGTRPANIDPLIKQMPSFFNQDMVAKLTPMELKKSINMYLGRMMFRRLSGINQAYYLAHSYYFTNDMYTDNTLLNKLKTISVSDIKMVADKYLDPESSVTVILR